MNRIIVALKSNSKSLINSFSRFPLTALYLAFATGLTWYVIWLKTPVPNYIEKLVYITVLGAIMSAAAQSAYERFSVDENSFLRKIKRLYYYICTVVLTGGYYIIIAPSIKISEEVSARTIVAIFALVCIYLWVPSYKKMKDFNSITLTHFKSIFIAILYAVVLSIGISSIIAAIDLLLYKINSDTYAYSYAVIWIFFMTMYYLSILPKFNSKLEEDVNKTERLGAYPKFLDILISNIAIPILTIFTGVLVIYFLKILITSKWPIGQVGPIVLGYSAAGIFIFILSGLLENNFAKLYRTFFPKFLIGVVIMQLVSVYIRINAYGVTESRYYVALFGIYSLVCGIILSIKPTGRNGLIVLIVAGFAIFSVVPPIDTFTVSRVSQINRIERILTSEGILSNGKITPKADSSENAKIEITNILVYLDNRGYDPYVKWLPKDFDPYLQMKTVIGFEPYYKFDTGNLNDVYVNLDTSYALDITGYDSIFSIYSDPLNKGTTPTTNIVIRGVTYNVKVTSVSKFDTEVAILDSSGNTIISTKLYEFAKGVTGSTNQKNMLPPSAMSFETASNGSSLKIIFQNIHLNNQGGNYGFYVLFKSK